MRSFSISRILSCLLLAGALSVSCDRVLLLPQGDWNERIPETTVAVYLPLRDEGISQLPGSGYTSLVSISDVGSTDWQQVFGSATDRDLPYLAKLLLPVTSTSLAPVWVLSEDQVRAEGLRGVRKEVFGESSYLFHGVRVHRLPLERLDMFASTFGGVTLLSTSARGIEEMVLAQLDLEPSFSISPQELRPGTVVVNGEGIDDWAGLVAAPLHRPGVQGISRGLGRWILRPVMDDTTLAWRLRGSFDVTSDTLGSMSEALSGLNRRIMLDRYVSSRAAAFSITQQRVDAPNPARLKGPTQADAFLVAEAAVRQEILSSLGEETAFVAFAESGFQGGSESIRIRELRDPALLRGALNRLVSQGHATLRSGLYTVESRFLSHLLLGDGAPPGPVYIDIVEEAVVASSRPGRTESVREDRRRRNVIRYDPEFVNRVPTSSRGFSFIASVRSEAFLSYIKPWLVPGTRHLDALGQVESVVIKGQREDPKGAISVDILAIPSKESRNPFRERWTYSLPEGALSAPAVLADIGGSARDEVIFSTVNGSLIALATDGTSVLQLSTSPDRPIGSPVLYDWYGNRQNVLMQAAGDKIYAWDRNGKTLPAFPVSLGEMITSPLLVQDLTRNGIPEMVVATADRRLHVLNSRGVPIPGWPQTTNTVITTPVRILQNGNQLAVAAASENTVHVWDVSGSLLNGFPIFTGAPVTGTPSQSGSTLLFSTISGQLFASPFASLGTAASGTFRFFDPSTATQQDASTTRTEYGEALQVSDMGLTHPPVLRPNVLFALEQEDQAGSMDEAPSTPPMRQFVREDVVLSASPNGSLFVHSKRGRLLFTASLGQALSNRTSPDITPLRDGDRLAVIAVGEYGRLFAWDLLSGNRVEDLPTSGMEFPIITDLDQDGSRELIALTREGLRCWTLQAGQ